MSPRPTSVPPLHLAGRSGRRGRIGAGCLWLVLLFLLGVAGASVLVARRVSYMRSKHEFVVSTWAEANMMYARRLELLEGLRRTPEGKRLVGDPAMKAVARARTAVDQVALPGEALPVTQEELDAYLAAQAAMTQWQGRFLGALEKAAEGTLSPELDEGLETHALAENRLGLAHRDFYDAVYSYNSAIRNVPDVFLAKLVGLTRCPQPEVRLLFVEGEGLEGEGGEAEALPFGGS